MTDRRERVLLLTRNLPPLVGGMERLNWHLARELSRRAQVRVVAPRGSAALAPPGVAVAEVPLRPLGWFLLRLQWAAWREAWRWRPDWILAGSGLTALPAWLAARGLRSRTAAYVHGLDLAVAHPVYRRLWLPALRRMHRVIANSRATAALAERAGVESSQIGIVHPGVELPGDRSGDDAAMAFRAGLGLGDRPLLVSVGRLSERKGLREFVAEALPAIVAACPGTVLLIVGDTPGDALHARAQTPESIRAAATRAGVAENVRLLGTITEFSRLAAVYRAADVHVFPLREIPNDPEGFGMVAVEAAAHGLPTVAFTVGGVADAVAEGESGYLVRPGDQAALAAAVVRALAAGRGAWQPACEAFARRFAWPRFGEQVAAGLGLSAGPAD